MQIEFARHPIQQAQSRRSAGAATGLRAGHDADMEGVRNMVMYAGSHGALLGAVEVCDNQSSPTQLVHCHLPCMDYCFH